MNNMLVLQIGLLVSFSNSFSMWNSYACDYNPDGSSTGVIAVKFDTGYSNKGFWFSQEDRFHNFDKEVFSLRLGSANASIKAKGEFLAVMMKLIAEGSRVSIETTLPDKKKVILWTLMGEGEDEARQRAVQYFSSRLNKSLKAVNKNLVTVAIEPQERGDNRRAILQTPSVFIPLASLSVSLNDKKVLTIDRESAYNLHCLSMLTAKNNENKGSADTITCKSGGTSEEIMFLDNAAVIKQLESYFLRLEWRNRGIFGISFAAIVAALAYFNLQSK